MACLVRQAGQVVNAYTFTYAEGTYTLDPGNTGDIYGVYFWWPTQITPYGSDYVAPNTGTALPAQVFTYEQDASGSCDALFVPNC